MLIFDTIAEKVLRLRFLNALDDAERSNTVENCVRVLRAYYALKEKLRIEDKMELDNQYFSRVNMVVFPIKHKN